MTAYDMHDYRRRMSIGFILVLTGAVLPFLMMLMSMIIVFGYAATWKLRTETVARDTVWRVRWHRFANGNARPGEWPVKIGYQHMQTGTGVLADLHPSLRAQFFDVGGKDPVNDIHITT